MSTTVKPPLADIESIPQLIRALSLKAQEYNEIFDDETAIVALLNLAADEMERMFNQLESARAENRCHTDAAYSSPWHEA